MNIDELYQNRFAGKEAEKQAIWAELCRYFQIYIPAGASILDVAGGYGEFINHIQTTGRKIAVDINPDSAKFLNSGIEFRQARADQVSDVVPQSSVDVVFVSNFFEHLNSSEELVRVLMDISKVLVPNGQLLVLQPNIKYVKEAYWDFLDHKLPITENRLAEACSLAGLECEKQILRFLPYTSCGKGHIPAFLVRWYLKLMPLSGLVFGKQSFFVFRKAAT